jgi:hypothetical protein
MKCEVCDGEFVDYHDDGEPGAKTCSIMCAGTLTLWFMNGGDLAGWRFFKRWQLFTPKRDNE